MNLRLIIRFAIIISIPCIVLISIYVYNRNHSTTETILDWADREILFPDSIIVEMQNQPIQRDLVLREYDFAIYTILDTDKGCTSCQLMLLE